MDPLTHALAGAAVADVVGMPGEMKRAALPFSMILAAAPDVDVIPALVAAFPSNPFTVALFDPGMMQRYHRSYTHAFPIMAAAAIAFGLFGWRLWGGGGSWRRWIMIAAAALASHSLLDIANGYVRLWLPFSKNWIGWGYAPEGDPLLLAAFGVVFLANHPFHLTNRYNLGTLAALEKTSNAIHDAVRPRVGVRTLALLGLAAVPLRVLIGYWL